MRKVSNRKTRLANKRRFVFSMMIIGIFISLCSTVASKAFAYDSQTQSVKYDIITVSGGDTLDGLIMPYKPSGIDIRKFREQVKDINNMTSSTIYSGESIKVPINKK